MEKSRGLLVMTKYEKFFNDFTDFKTKQNKQKQRGLNNYNILTTVLKSSDEVRLHSRMIHSLLNPLGEHYQGELFLEKFIKILDDKGFGIDLNHCSVYKEYKSIDLYITDNNKHIIIENKLYARDQKEQIKRYVEVIQKSDSSITPDDILVVYLSIDRAKPSGYSLGNLAISGSDLLNTSGNKVANFKSISYNKEILGWLKESQLEVQNITNLNEVLRQYIDVIKMVNNNYKSKVMSVSDFIIENKTNYEISKEIAEHLYGLRKKYVDDFISSIIIKLKGKLNKDWEVIIENTKNLEKRGGVPLRIYKKPWVSGDSPVFYSDNYFIIFGFQFGKKEYYDGMFGIVKATKAMNIKEDIDKSHLDEINKIEEKRVETDWWLHRKEYKEDFVEKIIFEKGFEDSFVNDIIEMINKFEESSDAGKLITRINDDLASKYKIVTSA